jgi:hypothetical protein
MTKLVAIVEGDGEVAALPMGKSPTSPLFPPA